MLREDTVFGPIFSRRLGQSLGINLLPTKGKICNELGLDKNDNVWEKTIEILKSKNLIKYKNKRWEIVKEV